MSNSLILLAHCCSLAAGLFVVSQKCLLYDEGFKLLLFKELFKVF